MKDDRENFRENSNLLLKDIYVTDELKRKTLERCQNEKIRKIKPIFALAACVTFITISLGAYNYFSPKIDVANNFTDKTTKYGFKSLQEDKKTNGNSSIKNNEDFSKSTNSPLPNKNLDKAENINKNALLKNNPSNTNPSTDSVSNNTPKAPNSNTAILNNNTTPAKNLDNIPSPVDVGQDKFSLSEDKGNHEKPLSIRSFLPTKETLNISDAENYFESKLLVPSYVPEGFNLTDISIPDVKLKCVKLRYSSSSAYFQVCQNKNLSNLQGGKIVYINSTKAYISCTKDDKSNISTTQINWAMNNIQYSLTGSLSEDNLIKIAKSIN